MTGEAVSGAGPGAVSWSPGAVWPGVQIAAGVVLVVLGLQRAEPLALLLTGLAALFLIPSGVSQLLRRPRIEVVDGQLAIKNSDGRCSCPGPRWWRCARSGRPGGACGST